MKKIVIYVVIALVMMSAIIVSVIEIEKNYAEAQIDKIEIFYLNKEIETMISQVEIQYRFLEWLCEFQFFKEGKTEESCDYHNKIQIEAIEPLFSLSKQLKSQKEKFHSKAKIQETKNLLEEVKTVLREQKSQYAYQTAEAEMYLRLLSHPSEKAISLLIKKIVIEKCK